MPNSRDSLPLSAALTRIISFLESKEIDVPDWIERTVATAKEKIEIGKIYKEKYLMKKEKYKESKKEIDNLVIEIEELSDILSSSHDRIGNLNREIEAKNAEIAALQEEKDELIEERKNIDSFLRYIDHKCEKYFGIPQEEFLQRYNRWAEARTRELEESRNL